MQIRRNPPPATSHYTAEKAWLEHLRVLAELPYPGWALLPAIAVLLRQHIDATLVNFGWGDSRSQQPLGVWSDPIDRLSYEFFLSNRDSVFNELSIRAMSESRGRILREIETAPDYEQSALYQGVLQPAGVRWGMGVPVPMRDGSWLGFLTVYRRREAGPYGDAEQAGLDRVADALSHLDRGDNPLARLPAAGYCEAATTATMLLQADGRLLAESAEARTLLFLAGESGMGPPEWARSDWRALPAEVQAAARELSAGSAAGRREVSMRRAWGSFEFVVEKMNCAFDDIAGILVVTMRHCESLDIAVARGLWAWPLSPREKRILVASTRNPSLTELAAALGLTVGTLKTYINKMQNRLGFASRQALIERAAAGRWV